MEYAPVIAKNTRDKPKYNFLTEDRYCERNKEWNEVRSGGKSQTQAIHEKAEIENHSALQYTYIFVYLWSQFAITSFMGSGSYHVIPDYVCKITLARNSFERCSSYSTVNIKINKYYKLHNILIYILPLKGNFKFHIFISTTRYYCTCMGWWVCINIVSFVSELKMY